MFKLDHFGFLRVSGVDAVKFMQGYTTCDLDALDSASVQMGAICNLQGRMLTSFLVISEGADLILRMDRELVAATITFLSKYIVFSKAELADISDSLGCFGLIQPADNAVVEREPASYRISLGNRIECWLETAPDAAMETSNAPWIEAEIEAGVAWVSPSTSESLLPQSLNYHNLDAIDFKKGCYLGQEIVARLHYRGEVKKRLHRLDHLVPEQWDQGTVVASGQNSALAVLTNQGDQAHTISSVEGQTIIAQPL